jgi:hypothetical protein
MLHFLVAPGVPSEDRDAKDVGVRRIDERKNGLHVRASRTGGVLVNDDSSFGLRGERQRKERRAEQGFRNAANDRMRAKILRETLN